MLRSILRARGRWAQSSAPGGPLATPAGSHGPRQVGGGAGLCRAREDEALSSGKTATHTPPDNPPAASEDFDRLADLYLRGLWSKVEQMAEQRGGGERRGGDVDVQLEGGAMKLLLPEGGKITITKDPQGRSLVVHSNLHDFYGSDGTDSEVPFKLQRDRTWEADGEELHQFLEDGLAKHLKLQVDLEPDAQTIYGPDPT